MFSITRAELNKKYNLTPNDWSRKHDLVMEHLLNYMEITESKEKGQYIYEVKDELPESIPPVPRKSKKAAAEKDYDQFVKNYFSCVIPRYASKARVAREGMTAFGTEKYGHNNVRAVVRQYIAPAFDKYLKEVPDSQHLVWSETYEPLNDNELQRWTDILKEEDITEQQQAEAFREYCAGNDISEACAAYKNATNKFYGRAVKVSQYVLKE